MAMDKSRGAAAGKTMDKKAALETALAQIEKQFGKGAVMRLGQNEAMHVEAIPTGSLSLDLALGSRAAVSSRSTARRVPAKPRWPCIASRRGRRTAATRRSSM